MNGEAFCRCPGCGMCPAAERELAEKDRKMAKAAKKEEAKMSGADACVLMHTALRKSCDSPITSAAYNLIHMIEEPHIPREHNPWIMFGELVAAAVNAGEDPTKALGRLVHGRKLEDAWGAKYYGPPGRGERPKAPDIARVAMYALSCTFRCFTKQDFEGMAVHLVE